MNEKKEGEGPPFDAERIRWWLEAAEKYRQTHKAEFVGEWTEVTPEELAAYRLAIEYRVATERYDRELPGYDFRGEWIPDARHIARSRRFARDQRLAMRDKARHLGVKEEMLDRVLRAVSHLSYEEHVRLLDWARTRG